MWGCFYICCDIIAVTSNGLCTAHVLTSDPPESSDWKRLLNPKVTSGLLLSAELNGILVIALSAISLRQML